MIFGWFIWGICPIFHLIVIINESISLFLFGFFAFIGTYYVLAGMLNEFITVRWKLVNYGIMVFIIPFLLISIIFPDIINFPLPVVFQFLFVQTISIIGIINFKKIKEIGGISSLILFILTVIISTFQTIAFITISQFSSHPLSFGINYIIIFLITFFFVSVEQNIARFKLEKKASELIQSREKFQQLEKEKSLILSSVDDLIFYYSLPNYKIVWANQAVYDYYTISLEELTSKKCYESWLFQDEPCKNCPVIATFQTGKIFFQEMTSPDGKIWIVKSYPAYDEQGSIIGVVEVKRDVTDQKLLEEKLQQSQKMEAVGLLAGGIAHDFNNLLTVINGYSDMILDDINIDSKFRDDIADINVAGKRAAALTNQLLTFSRKQIVQLKVIDLNRVISDLEKMLQRLIGENINLSVSYSQDSCTIHGDQGQVVQCVMNLVINARDAILHQGKISVQTAKRNETDGVFVYLTIQDNGVGMSEEILNHIFDPFFTTKEVGKGTGLGLSTVYGIISQMKGNISVSSSLGEGTKFVIKIPYYEGRMDSSKNETILKLQSNKHAAILLVEDDELVRKFIVRSLTTLGYNVIQASNGVEALKIIKQLKGSIDLLISDVVMPHMNGIELSSKLLTKFPHLKIIFISGYTKDKLVFDSINKDVCEFLQKPFSMDDIIRKIEKVFL